MGTDRDQLDVYLSELKTTDAHLTSLRGAATVITRYVGLLIVAGVVAIDQLPLAFLLVPAGVVVWTFYVLSLDRDTIRLQEYRRYLERGVRCHIGKKILRYEELQERDQQELVNRALYVSYTIIGLSVWVIALVIIHGEAGWWWTAVGIAILVAFLAITAHTALGQARFRERMRTFLE